MAGASRPPSLSHDLDDGEPDSVHVVRPVDRAVEHIGTPPALVPDSRFRRLQPGDRARAARARHAGGRRATDSPRRHRRQLPPMSPPAARTPSRDERSASGEPPADVGHQATERRDVHRPRVGERRGIGRFREADVRIRDARCRPRHAAARAANTGKPVPMDGLEVVRRSRLVRAHLVEPRHGVARGGNPTIRWMPRDSVSRSALRGSRMPRPSSTPSTSAASRVSAISSRLSWSDHARTPP